MRMAWTIALRSRENHRNSFLKSALRPKRALRRGRPGRVSEGKAPARPLRTERVLNSIAAAVAAALVAQQNRRPAGNEAVPSGAMPRNRRSSGQDPTGKTATQAGRA